jgi:hypothetical protein
MKFLRVLGILVLIAGIVSILFSSYITEQVKEGKVQVAQGEKTVSQGKQLFSLTPLPSQVGDTLSGSAEKKIGAGKQQISQYEALAQQLQTGGIVGCVVGAGIIIISFFGKSKKRS